MDEMESAVESSSLSPPHGKLWTTDDFRKTSHQWTLAGDAALLNKLQDVAQNLISMTHNVQQDVDTLVEDTSSSHLILGNVINEFLMLSNTQFVENRVYDDEVTDVTSPSMKRPSPDRTKEEHRDRIVEKVSQALRLGMSVIETAYEQLHVQNSDSEDENETNVQEPILRPKDPYRGRPIPCIIGSSMFLEDDYVGLTALVLSEDEHVDEDVESISSIDENIPKNKVLPKDYSSEDEVNLENGISRPRERRDSEKSGDSDMFDPHKKDTDNLSVRSSSSSSYHQKKNEPLTVKRVSKTGDFQKELTSKLHPNKRRSDSESDASVEASEFRNQQSVKTDVDSRKNKSSVGFIDVDDDNDDGLFAPKKGLFSVKGSLFDDSADEEDLFIAKKPVVKNKKDSMRKPSLETNGSLSLPKYSDNLFADDGDKDVTGSSLDSTLKKQLTTRTESKSVESLFDEIDDDSIFSMDTTAKTTTPTKKVLPGSVSMFGGSVDPLAMKNSLKQAKSSQVKNEIKVSSVESLVNNKKEFGIDDADVKRPSSETSSRSSITSRTLFVEEPDLDDLFSSSEVTKRKPIGGISLFDGDEDENDIFATNIKLDGDSTKKSETVISQIESESANNFFDDIFAQIVKPRESLQKTSSSLFDDDQEDLFVQPKVSKKKTDSKMKVDDVENKPESQRKVSLFDDNDDGNLIDGDDLFGPIRSFTNKDVSSTGNISLSSSSSLEGRGQSLFFDDDDSLLFGVTTKTAPSTLSLFDDDDNLKVDPVDQNSRMKEEAKSTSKESEKASTTTKKKSKPEVEASTSTSSKTTFTLDDNKDDVEDDLFAVKKVNKKTVPEKQSTLFSDERKVSVSPRLPIKSVVPGEINKKDDSSEKKSSIELKKHELTASIGSVAESPSKKKPPVGGVALFCGALTPVLKPKSSKTLSDKSPARSEVDGQTVSVVKQEIRPTSPFGGSSPILPRVIVAATDKPAVDFEKPVEANPLHNANKDRIKIPVKRRPSTRRGRQEALRRSAIDMVIDDGHEDDIDFTISDRKTETISAPTSPLTPDPQKVADFTKELSKKIEEDKAKKSTSPVPSKDDNTNAKSDNASKASSSSAVKQKIVRNELSDSDDILFGTNDKKSTKKSKDVLFDLPKTPVKQSLLSDLDSDSNTEEDLFSSKSKPKDESSSLFGTSNTKSLTSKVGRGKSLFDDLDDDDEVIFKSTSTMTSKSNSTSGSKSTTGSVKKIEKNTEFEDPLMANKKN